jgi:SnoaL-like domain
MPWSPEFTSAVELARRQTRAAGQADPVAQYFTALNKGDTHALETVRPDEVVIHDPRAGEIRGHKQLRRFVRQNQSWLAPGQDRARGLHVCRQAGRGGTTGALGPRRTGSGLADGTSSSPGMSSR